MTTHGHFQRSPHGAFIRSPHGQFNDERPAHDPGDGLLVVSWITHSVVNATPLPPHADGYVVTPYTPENQATQTAMYTADLAEWQQLASSHPVRAIVVHFNEPDNTRSDLTPPGAAWPGAYIGLTTENVPWSGMTTTMTNVVQQTLIRFQDVWGYPARLVGMANVYHEHPRWLPNEAYPLWVHLVSNGWLPESNESLDYGVPFQMDRRWLRWMVRVAKDFYGLEP